MLERRELLSCSISEHGREFGGQNAVEMRCDGRRRSGLIGTGLEKDLERQSLAKRLEQTRVEAKMQRAQCPLPYSGRYSAVRVLRLEVTFYEREAAQARPL